MKLITFVAAACLCLVALTACSKSKLNGQATASPQPGSDNVAQASANKSPSTEESPIQTSEQTGETQSGQGEVADPLHTPPKGSPERQAIMDAMREDFNDRSSPTYQPHKGQITFVVNYLKVHNGWAWVYATPQSSDPRDSFGENNGVLLHRENGKWRLMALPPMVEDPNDPENLDYPTPKDVQRIKQKYPSMPTDIINSK
ncbi:MAG: hypothetical protein M3362_10415 [Acidobacteriota bacterium]|nr:hypothetical protein [Acidobacteriota bacterium]